MQYDGRYREGVLLAMRTAYGYKHATSTETSTPFKATGFFSRSADSQILTGLHHRILRERGREVVRDDPIASGLEANWTRNVVGTGLQDRAATGDREQDEAQDDAWNLIKDDLFPAERVSWAEAQRILCARAFTDGDVFVKRSTAPGGGRLFFEIVEGDRVRTPLDVRQHLAHEENFVREGVERDRFGRVVGYWVAKRHPGDVVMTGSAGKIPLPPITAQDYDRVGVDDLYHLKAPTRAGESRSPSRLHAVLQDLRDLDLLILAVLKRVQVAASFAVFIETSADVPDIMPMTARKYNYQLNQDLVPGMIYVLRPGESAKCLNPNFPLPDLDRFVRLLARRIGAALGISWQLVLADFSEANFASQRADRLEAEVSYAIPRQRTEGCLRWIRRSALEDAVIRGNLDTPVDTLSLVTFIAPRREHVDQEKQAKADQIELEIGLACRRDKAAARGMDWEDLLRQRLLEEKREAELRKEMGLDPLPTPNQAAGVDESPNGDGEDAEGEGQDERPKNGDRMFGGRLAGVNGRNLVRA